MSNLDAEQRIETARAAQAPVLDLSGCGLRRLPDAVRECTHVESLNLQFNSIDDLPDWLTELDRLTELNISNNGLEEIPEVIGRLTGLRKLDLSEQNLEAASLDFLGNLTELTELVLIDTRQDRLPESVGNLSHLTSLNLYLGWFTDEPWSLPGALGQCAALTSLELGGTGVAAVPGWIRRLTNLRYLGLWRTEVELPEWIGELTALTEIHLPFEPDDRTVSLLRRLPHLERVESDDGELDMSG